MSRMSSSIARFCALVVLASSANCTTMEPAKPAPTFPQAPPLAYKFSYDAPKIENPARVSIALGVIQTRLAGVCPSPAIGPLTTEFTNSMQSSFQSTLLAKGYSLSGPFENREQMTYGQKESAMLLLIPAFSLALNCTDSNRATVWSGESGESKQARTATGVVRVLRGTTTIETVSGSVGVAFGLDLTLLEPLTGEKLWLKSVKPTASAEEYSYYTRTLEYTYFEGTLGDALVGGLRKVRVGNPEVTVIKDSDRRPNAIAAALEKLFGISLDQFSRYFDPREIAEVVKDSDRVRKLKRY